MFRVTEQIAIKHRHAQKPNEIKNARPCQKETVSGTFFNTHCDLRVLFPFIFADDFYLPKFHA